MEDIKFTTIKGFENYTISNYGDVFLGKRKIIPSDNGNGYLFVRLSKDGKRYNRYIHRLVYENFVGEIKNEINHKDHKKYNNYVKNLEDVSHKENMICAKNKYGEYYLPSMNQPRKGTINQYNLNGEKIQSFKSVKSAAQWILHNVDNKKTNNINSVISTLNKHLSGKRKSYYVYNFIWKEELK